MIEDNPEEWIFDLFTADYYKGDPLGLPVLGVEESVERLDEGPARWSTTSTPPFARRT